MSRTRRTGEAGDGPAAGSAATPAVVPGDEPETEDGSRRGGVAVVNRAGVGTRRTPASLRAGHARLAPPDAPEERHEGAGAEGSRPAEPSAGEVEVTESSDPPAHEPRPDDHDTGPVVRPGRARRGRARRWGRRAVWVVAVAGVVGTALFGHAWASDRAQAAQRARARTVAHDFLLALTNFDSKSVDADFNRIESYATGDFAKQATHFFGSSIRKELEAASASSRGQIRDLYVQSVTGTKATVFGVVDQTYVNNKMQAPAADVLRVVTDLAEGSGGWKVSDVTVLGNPGGSLGGATASSAGSSAGSSGTAGSSATSAGGTSHG